MNQEPAKHRSTTGDNRKLRVETWLSRNQHTWLKGLAIQEDRSMSSVLRRALRLYIGQVIKEQGVATGDQRG